MQQPFDVWRKRVDLVTIADAGSASPESRSRIAASVIAGVRRSEQAALF